eukprot:scaffold90697_cov31-Tisochrysis_lutea.AAC.6
MQGSAKGTLFRPQLGARHLEHTSQLSPCVCKGRLDPYRSREAALCCINVAGSDVEVGKPALRVQMCGLDQQKRAVGCDRRGDVPRLREGCGEALSCLGRGWPEL